MKGIVVVDIPERCLNCLFFSEIYEGTEACCTLADDEEYEDICRRIEDYYQGRPKWCPIKPLPEKKELKGNVSNAKGISEESIRIGWNKCIDKILNEQ